MKSQDNALLSQYVVYGRDGLTTQATHDIRYTARKSSITQHNNCVTEQENIPLNKQKSFLQTRNQTYIDFFYCIIEIFSDLFYIVDMKHDLVLALSASKNKF